MTEQLDLGLALDPCAALASAIGAPGLPAGPRLCLGCAELGSRHVSGCVLAACPACGHGGSRHSWMRGGGGMGGCREDECPCELTADEARAGKAPR